MDRDHRGSGCAVGDGMPCFCCAQSIFAAGTAAAGQTGAEKADGEAGNIIASNKILSLRTVVVLDAAGNLVQNYNESTSTEELLKKASITLGKAVVTYKIDKSAVGNRAIHELATPMDFPRWFGRKSVGDEPGLRSNPAWCTVKSGQPLFSLTSHAKGYHLLRANASEWKHSPEGC